MWIVYDAEQNCLHMITVCYAPVFSSLVLGANLEIFEIQTVKLNLTQWALTGSVKNNFEQQMRKVCITIKVQYVGLHIDK